MGSVVPYDNGRNVKDAHDSRIFYRDSVLPPQTVSPHCFFRTNTMVQEKSISEPEKDSQTKQQPPLCGVGVGGNWKIDEVWPGLSKIKVGLFRYVDLIVWALAKVIATKL